MSLDERVLPHMASETVRPPTLLLTHPRLAYGSVGLCVKPSAFYPLLIRPAYLLCVPSDFRAKWQKSDGDGTA